jgi:hypothetical protein
VVKEGRRRRRRRGGRRRRKSRGGRRRSMGNYGDLYKITEKGRKRGSWRENRSPGELLLTPPIYLLLLMKNRSPGERFFNLGGKGERFFNLGGKS